MMYDVGDVVVMPSGDNYIIDEVKSDYYVFKASGYTWVDHEINHEATSKLILKNSTVVEGYMTIKFPLNRLADLLNGHPQFNIEVVTSQDTTHLLKVTKKHKTLKDIL